MSYMLIMHEPHEGASQSYVCQAIRRQDRS
jgi:hypothetical protein